MKIPSVLQSDQAKLAARGEQLPMEAAAQLIIPAKLLPGLIDALNSQRERYEKVNGPIQGKGGLNG